MPRIDSGQSSVKEKSVSTVASNTLAMSTANLREGL